MGRRTFSTRVNTTRAKAIRPYPRLQRQFNSKKGIYGRTMAKCSTSWGTCGRNIALIPHDPNEDALILYKDAKGVVTWMAPSSMRTVRHRKRKREELEDDEVSTSPSVFSSELMGPILRCLSRLIPLPPPTHCLLLTASLHRQPPEPLQPICLLRHHHLSTTHHHPLQIQPLLLAITHHYLLRIQPLPPQA
jgi:hypothetical protein